MKKNINIKLKMKLRIWENYRICYLIGNNIRNFLNTPKNPLKTPQKPPCILMINTIPGGILEHAEG